MQTTVCKGPSAILCLTVKLLNHERNERKEGNIQPSLSSDA